MLRRLKQLLQGVGFDTTIGYSTHLPVPACCLVLFVTSAAAAPFVLLSCLSGRTQ